MGEGLGLGMWVMSQEQLRVVKELESSRVAGDRVQARAEGEITRLPAAGQEEGLDILHRAGTS